MEIAYLASRRTSKRMASSPLREWTLLNSASIQCHANKMHEIRSLRSRTLKKIGDLLSEKSQDLTVRRNLIPEVQFQPTCASYVIIIFPQDLQIVDRFLADSNLGGLQSVERFTGYTIYTDKNHYRSYATSLLVSGRTINDLIDAAHTFKNISHLTHKNTQVQILSDSDKIQCNHRSLLVRKIELYFVKRDRRDFRPSDYKTCSVKTTGFLKRYPDLTFTIGFVGRWLGDTVLITIQGPFELPIKYNNLCADLIQVVNLIKGIIFQKIMDRTCWLHLTEAGRSL
jgi:hypothetical protein